MQSEATLEIPRRDGARRVHVSLGPPLLRAGGELRRSLFMATDKSESRGLVEPSVSWDAVLAQAGMLLALEEESLRREES